MSVPGGSTGNDESDVQRMFGPDVPALEPNATVGMRESHWYEHVYRGDSTKQLTFRAVALGGFIGMAMSIAGLYTTLKIGWAFGVAITACVISYVSWNILRAVTGNKVSQMTILENNCMQSTASAAGYSTGATIATAFGALLLLTHGDSANIKTWDVQPVWIVAAFTFVTGAMGVFLAIPMKRQMINQERLAFPSGIAAAETLRALYSAGREAKRKAYSLVIAMVTGAIIGILNTGEGGLRFLDKVLNATFRLPESLDIPAGWLGYRGLAHGGKEVVPYGFAFEPSGLLIAAGMIVGLRVSLSMLAGSALLYLFVGPYLIGLDQGAVGSGWSLVGNEWVFDKAAMSSTYALNIDVHDKAPILMITRWSLWGGTALMVFSSLTALAFQWKAVLRSFGIGKGKGGGEHDLTPKAQAIADRIEVPSAWFIAGYIPIAIALVVVNYFAFHMNIYLGVIAAGMSFILSMVACRATGETDTNPIGAMGKVMQLLFAVLPGAKGNQTINLMSASTGANSASSSADLLTDLKSGYLLGANPRKQFIAQAVGIFFGTLAIVPAWYLMVPTKEALEKYPAPATNMWKAVAEVLAGEKGFNALPDSAKMAMVIGALVGIVLPIIEKLFPKARPYMPSAMGLGLAWVVTFSNSLGFTIGAVIAYIWSRTHKGTHDKYNIPIASGLVAGESLIKAALAMLATASGLAGWNL